MPDDDSQPPTVNSTVEHAEQAALVQSNGIASPRNCETPVQPHSQDDTGDETRPSKRRKLTDSLTPQQRPSPRVQSPPWRAFSADGPTTFLEGGKRRSGRTNALPLDLQPSSGQRRTRATGQRTAASSSRYSSTPSQKADIKPEPSSLAKSTPKHARTESKASQASEAVSTTKSRRQSSLFKRETTPPTPTGRKQKSKGKADGVSKGHPPAARAVRQSSRLAGESARGSARTSRTADAHLKFEYDRSLSESEASGSDGSDDSTVGDASMEDYVPDPSAKLQKLKFNIRRPTLGTPSYGNTLKFARDTRQQVTKRQFSSIHEWMSWAIEKGHQIFPGYDVYEGDEEYMKEAADDIEERRWHRELARQQRAPVKSYTIDEAREEAKLRETIEKELEPGGLIHPDSCTQLMPEKFDLPRKQYGHWDHVLAHAANFSKLLEREQRNHREHARRLAYAAQEKWNSIQPKSQEEMEQEREETRRTIVTSTFRQCLKDLVLKFDMFRSELDKIRLARWQEEQEALGKKALNKVMERSAKLLDARRRQDASDPGSGTEGDDDDDDDGADAASSEASSEGGSELDDDAESKEAGAENMSSDDSDSADSEQSPDSVDENLTVEELRRKYADADAPLPDQTLSEEEDDNDVAMGGTPVFNDDALISHVDDAAQIMYEAATDESDESVDMSEEMSSGEEDDGESEEDSDGSDVDDNLGLFSLIASDFQLTAAKESLPVGPDDAKVSTSNGIAAEATTIGHYHVDVDDDEELEEVSLIPDNSMMREPSIVPDAAQVQTPAASNDEAGPESSRMESHSERPSKLSVMTSSSPHKDTDSYADAMEHDAASQQAESLPATPVSSNDIKTHVPSLLRATLREYQHYGLDWLAGLYAKKTNGILADEMGLGKTIQTIALMAHIAEVHGVWGPHLVVVPTSVMLNWEVEFKKFLPGFKVLVYYGTPEERKSKRRGWLNDDKWNVVITSYQLVLQDATSFKHRSWHYMVLDEAHNIKNWKSARWQTLLGFRTSHRLLLTGTPLQNNLTELWSLMFFLMPDSEDDSGRPQFTGLEEFTSWFNKPVHQIMEQGRGDLTDEARELVQRLHTILRPYILRRLKADVEKQMPGKYEHVVYCKLSKRQRYLYDGFMSRTSTRETLSSGNYLSIINCLMQLRKVCNHPDLFETRQIVTSFAMPKAAVADFEIKELLVRKRLLAEEESEQLSLRAVNLLPASHGPLSAVGRIRQQRLGALERFKALIGKHVSAENAHTELDLSDVQDSLSSMQIHAHRRAARFLDWQWHLQRTRSQEQPLMNQATLEVIRRMLAETRREPVELPLLVPHNDFKVIWRTERSHALPLPPRPPVPAQYGRWLDFCTPALQELTSSVQSRAVAMQPYIRHFGCITPSVVAHEVERYTIGKPGIQIANKLRPALMERSATQADPYHESQTRLSIAFPDKRLLQYDCGKLQRLDTLLRTLQAGGHRALIFTQMTKVLDILEQFLNIHGHRYLRLDGSTKIEQRQILTDRFNSDNRILAFILSSRSGGLGINLTGADTVIFYDLDWNPAMDKQCQDRCHRIGQTRDVHIYRFVSEYTIEANILRKANQKRLLDDVIIKDGDFTTDHFNKPDVHEVEEKDEMHEADADANAAMDRILGAGPAGDKISTKLLAHAEDKEDIQAAAVAEKEGHTDDKDFNETPSAAPTRADTPRTPGPRAITPYAIEKQPVTEGARGDDKPEFFTGSVEPRTEAAWQVFADKAGIGVDRFILEHLEWELKDVPIMPPEDKSKKKKVRKSEQYSTKRWR